MFYQKRFLCRIVKWLVLYIYFLGLFFPCFNLYVFLNLFIVAIMFVAVFSTYELFVCLLMIGIIHPVHWLYSLFYLNLYVVLSFYLYRQLCSFKLMEMQIIVIYSLLLLQDRYISFFIPSCFHLFNRRISTNYWFFSFSFVLYFLFKKNRNCVTLIQTKNRYINVVISSVWFSLILAIPV